MAMLLQRVAQGANAMSARAALRLATRGGAAVLRRSDLGSLAVGKRADLAIWDGSTPQNAGSCDPVAGLVLCGPQKVRDLVVEARVVVCGGELATLPLRGIVERQKALARRLMA